MFPGNISFFNKKLFRFVVMNILVKLLSFLFLFLAFACSDSSDDGYTTDPEPDKKDTVSWRYISKVWEYCPAPGQFINGGTSGVLHTNVNPTYEEVLQNVSKSLVGKTNGLITLGGFGGYIVVGFDHPIKNIPGEYDFKVYGNAFWDQTTNVSDGGSCEPGVIMVSQDVNGNGIPDDKWYEIKGSAYAESDTAYEIVYYKTTEPGDVPWKDNRNQNGHISYLPEFHAQNYFPSWVTADSLVFKGTKLPNVAKNEGEGENEHWVLYALDWGYADNYPDNTDGCKIKIDWAIDKKGESADLSEISFIRIHTGPNQQCGWIGEISTELSGIENLNSKK